MLDRVPDAPSIAPSGRARRALVADDDETNLRMLARLVRSWGFETIVATNGTCALEILESDTPPDVAILDWMMPGLSGPDVCRAVEGRAGRTHLVVLTARCSSADLVEALDAGADDYVTKPIDFDVLRARVEAGARRRPREATPPLVEPGAVFEGRYRLEAPIGQGGMGAVWRATHLGLGTTVALKLVRTESAALPLIRERFEREAKSLASIASEHVVRVMDFGEAVGGQRFLVMEYLAGRTLEEQLAQDGPLAVDEAARVIGDIARGLDAAHEAGVLHRDVKPGNVFLTQTARGAIAKLLDFGLAKPTVEARALTGHGQILGTVGFMSPAQLMGDPATRECDLWALAATAVAALTGSSPFDAAVPSVAILSTLQGPPPRPSTLRAGLPAALDAWAETAFTRERERGFKSAGELASAFGAAVRLES